MPDAATATDGSPRHLEKVLRAMHQVACDKPPEPQLLVLAGSPPSTHTFSIFQPTLRLRQGGAVVTVASGSFDIGSGTTPDAFNWWRFIP